MFAKILNIFCIGFVYINSDLRKVYHTCIMYAICIQQSYRMNVQIFAC